MTGFHETCLWLMVFAVINAILYLAAGTGNALDNAFAGLWVALVNFVFLIAVLLRVAVALLLKI